MISIIVPYRPTTQERIDRWVWVENYLRTLLPEAEIVTGDCEVKFNRSQARNNAVKKSTGDILLLVDADTVFSPQYLQVLDDLSWDWCVTEQYVELSYAGCLNILSQSPIDFSVQPQDIQNSYQNYAGALWITREAFEIVDGFDERFRGWGYEDAAFALSVGTLVGDPLRVLGSFSYHLWHTINPKEQWQQPYIQESQKLCQLYVDAAGEYDKMKTVRFPNKDMLMVQRVVGP